ncbi:MAG: hypothetical protein RML32_06205 [Gammaproteobacteria bacterium]|nr:hypothetical protein [Gammaproteobacteria bacterium]
MRNELRYGRATVLRLTIGLSSQKVLLAPPPNSRRAFLFVVNTHATNILFMNLGNEASTLDIPILPANGAIGFDNFVPQDDVYLVANGAGTTAVLVYSNKGLNDYPMLAGG